jgi:hypothetical protein
MTVTGAKADILFRAGPSHLAGRGLCTAPHSALRRKLAYGGQRPM